MGTQTLAVDTKPLETGLARIQREAQAIIVKDAETCLAAKTMQRDVRAYIKDVNAKLSPFVDAAKANLAKAKDELNRWVDPAEAIDGALAQKVKDYERKEREAAEAETRRINEERRVAAAKEAEEKRKAAEAQAEEDRKKRQKEIEEARKAGEVGKREADRLKKEAEEAEARAKKQADEDAAKAAANVVEVKVQPSIPTVAGVPSRRNWRWKLIDESKIPDRFWIVNEQYIGSEVRRIKDKGKAESEIPGIECWQE